jgi:hypothetical protein
MDGHVQITCLDDVPDIAAKAARQRFLGKWYRPIGLVPFAVVVFTYLKFFPQSTSPIPIVLVFASLIWAMVVAGYSIVLRFTVRCPACGRRFGSRNNCGNCGLPLHAEMPSATDGGLGLE